MSETTSLLSGKKKEGGELRHRSFGSFSRFGPDVETSGVKPSGDSISNIPQVLEEWHRRSISNQADVADQSVNFLHKSRKSTGQLGLGGSRRARSFVQNLDGSMTQMTPLEMGRQELYEVLPFLAVPGLQKKEHNLSVAFSSYAAQLDTLETDEYLTATSGKPLNPEEKEQRLSQMSLLLLDELEVDAITVTTPLIFATLQASLLMFNMGYNISVMNGKKKLVISIDLFSSLVSNTYNSYAFCSIYLAPEPFVFPGHSTSAWSMAVAAFCVG